MKFTLCLATVAELVPISSDLPIVESNTMPSLFDIKEHTIEASYIREYARATSHSQDEKLLLHVKQYIPKDNPNPQKGDVTLIGGHANGFPKVSLCYALITRLELSDLSRNYMNLCGKNFTRKPRAGTCGFVVSGWPMQHGKARAVLSTKTPSAMTVRPLPLSPALVLTSTSKLARLCP